MLTFEQKLAIIETYPQLERKDVSLGRVNFHFEESVTEKKNVVYHLHPNGNGFVYTERIKDFPSDHKGMVNIRDFSEKDLRAVIEQSMLSLSAHPEEDTAAVAEMAREQWINDENHTLTLVHEDDEMWNVYAGGNLDGTFLSYNEAKQYLEEEGFKKQ